MINIKEYLDIKKQSWATKRKMNRLNNNGDFEQFKNFFFKLSDCDGFKICILNKNHEKRYYGTSNERLNFYKIKPNENLKQRPSMYNSQPYNYSFILWDLFKENDDLMKDNNEWWNRYAIHMFDGSDIQKDYILCIFNLDPEEINFFDSLDIGFVKIYSENLDSEYFSFKEKIKDDEKFNGVFISFEDLYKNAAKINKKMYEIEDD